MKEIKLPKDWNGVSINQWKEMIEITQQEGISGLDMNLGILSVLSSLPVEEIEQLPLSTVNEMMKSIEFISIPPKASKNPKKEYTIKGNKYKVFKRLEDINTSAYIDFQTYSKDMDNNIGEIIAIFLIPEGHKYNDGYDLAETIAYIKDNLGVEDALSLVSFFGTLFLKSILSSLHFSNKELMKMKKTNPEKYKELTEKIEKSLQSILG